MRSAATLILALASTTIPSASAGSLLAQSPAVTVPSQRTTAQEVAQGRYGRALSNQDIADAILRSGLSQADLRARLQQAGLDPNLADPFFAQGGLGQQTAGNPADAQFVSALDAMGVLGTATGAGVPSPLSPVGLPGAVGATTASGAATEVVFGRGIFTRRTTLFDPVTSGPIDPSYRLGPGDQLQLVLTGDVENAYQIVLRRDGTALLPQLGQVALGGLTLDAARGLLRQRAARVYSGVNSGRTQIDLSVSEVRTNVVYVLGEVEAPGAYQVSALSTVLHAVARAGGPTTRGSFREIEVRRAGRLAHTVDIYPFLLTGDVSSDVRTEQGDVIYVPLKGRTIETRGEFRRPSLFELRPTEGFADLMRFAGGLTATASTERLNLDRVLPPDQRTPAHERVVIDLSARGGVGTLDTTSLYDGDVLTAFGIETLKRNAITISGEVYHEGVFQWVPGLRLGDAIAHAQGPKPWGLMDRVKVRRQLMQTGRTETYSLDAETASGREFELQEFDSVTVLDARTLYPDGPVRLLGAVNKPGSLPYSSGLTLRDAIDLSEGLQEGAATVEISRRLIGDAYNDTSAVVRRVAVDTSGLSVPGADTIVLQRFDIVTVRFSPGYRTPETVTLSGSFAFPGTYTLISDGERLSAVVGRAGGLLPTAFPESFRLLRSGRPVALSLANALRHRQGDDIILEPNDQLSIGTDPSVVQVSGAVQRQVSIPFRSGWSLSDYINAAGGFADNANSSKRFVEYASGAVARPHRTLLLFGGEPDIRPGSIIVIPEKPPKTGESHLGAVLATTFQVVATMASLSIAYIAATR